MTTEKFHLHYFPSFPINHRSTIKRKTSQLTSNWSSNRFVKVKRWKSFLSRTMLDPEGAGLP
ncbi:hypothetical protein K0M31_001393 [Melipona bicolor]|uniref:Uncharacterized protein n=1 Tax=Melipona bicolor TaxID=60889 RepID=A0AA40GFK3_9HYME|nr:hypothetical protein K0M31_001393 [Melipona bicolor]